MSDHRQTDEQPTRRERAWAAVRLVLGLAQMGGAVIGFVFLFQTGLSAFTIAAVLLTTACTCLSRFLFAGRKD